MLYMCRVDSRVHINIETYLNVFKHKLMILRGKKNLPRALKVDRRAQGWLFDTVAPRVKTAPSFIRDNAVSSAEGPPPPPHDNAAMSPSIHGFVYQTVPREDGEAGREAAAVTGGDEGEKKTSREKQVEGRKKREEYCDGRTKRGRRGEKTA